MVSFYMISFKIRNDSIVCLIFSTFQYKKRHVLTNLTQLLCTYYQLMKMEWNHNYNNWS